MKKQRLSLKRMLGIFVAIGSCVSLQAQLTETMGTAGPATETIAAREANNRFDMTALTYSGTADVRNTVPSTGYSGFSGGYNVLIQAQETFQVQVINAATCSPTDSISFGVFKTTNASTGIDYLALEYSNDNGSTWVNIPYTALPTGSGTSKWYRRAVVLPAAAHVSNLWLRFRSSLVGTSSSNPQFRIDDLRLSCGSDMPCDTASTAVALSGSAVYCAGSGSTTLTATTTLVNPLYQWYNQNGPVAGAETNIFTPATSGSYYVKVSNEDGCESVSGKTYILVYPKPSYCVENGFGCSDDTLNLCARVQAQDLIISEYVEGTGNNKYLEIYNGTCKQIDLSTYQVRAYHNGALPSGAPSYVIALSGTLPVGAAYVIAHPSATAWTGTPNLTSANLQFNGNDALVLFEATRGAVDIFGSVGHDPGSSWRNTTGTTTVDKTLARKACVYSGITVNPDLPGISGFPTLFTEWDTLGVNNTSGLGSHVMGASSYSFTVVSGSANIASSAGSCVKVVPGNGTSTLSVNGVFCTFNNCTATGNLFTVSDDSCKVQPRSVKTTGIRSAVDSKEAQVYPNPFGDFVTVAFANILAGKVDIRIVDMYGKTVSVLNSRPMAAGAYELQFDVSALAAGTYVCHIQTASGRETVRIIKSK